MAFWAAPRRRLDALSGRLGNAAWGVLDQALSSLTNFLLSVVVARSLSADDFGAYSLGFSTYVLLGAVSRSIASIPLTIRYSSTGEDAWRSATAASTGTALVFGVLGGAVTAAIGLIVGGTAGGAIAVVGILLMPLLLQDAWRFAFFAARRGRSAFMNDLVWAIALVPTLLWAAASGGTLQEWLVAWAVAGGAGGIVGVWQARLWPNPRRVLEWLNEHRALVPQLTAENVILTGTSYITLVAVTFTTGLRAVAALRAANVLLNALNIATTGVQLFAVPEAVAIARVSMGRLRRYCLLIGGGLLAVSAVWGALLLFLPTPIGRALLGDSWDAAQPVLLPLAILAASSGLRVGAFVGLRALALVRESLAARTASSLLQVSGGVTGAVVADALGAAWGMAVANVAGSVIWWGMLVRALRGREPEPVSSGAPTSPPAG